jgi:hypothetical protein
MKEETKTKIMFGVSGLTGGLVAVLADVCQKEQASSFLKMANVLKTQLSLPLSLLISLVVVLAIAGFLPIIFERKNKAESFYIGASVLAMLMTMMPYKTPEGIALVPRDSAARTENGTAAPDGAFLDLFTPRAALAQVSRAEGKRRLYISLRGSGGTPVREALVTLRDPSSGETLGSSRVAGSRFTLHQRAGVYILTIEVEGYESYNRTVDLSEGSPIKRLDIKLNESGVPMTLQRLMRR